MTIPELDIMAKYEHKLLSIGREGSRGNIIVMPLRRYKASAGFNVPQLNSTIARRRRKLLAVWREHDRVNNAIMSFERNKTGARRGVPKSDSFIV